MRYGRYGLVFILGTIGAVWQSGHWLSPLASPMGPPPNNKISGTSTHTVPQTTSRSAEPTILAAVLYLVQPERTGELCESLKALYVHFLAEYPYPVYMMVESSLPNQRQLQACAPNITLKQIVIDFPKEPTTFMNRLPWGTGYKSMCEFWIRGVFDVPEIAALEYYLRLDTDSHITSRIQYDIFSYMKTAGKSYMYRSASQDAACVSTNLGRFAREYLIMEGRRVPEFVRRWDREAIYNNFEVVHVPRFRQDDIRRFSSYVSNGTWVYRWGDALVRWLSIGLFLTPSAVERLCSFGYQHQGGFPPDCPSGVMHPPHPAFAVARVTYTRRSAHCQEEQLQRLRASREEFIELQQKGGALDDIKPWNWAGAAYLWDFLPTMMNCPERRRIGPLASPTYICDLGGWMASQACVVVVVGSMNNAMVDYFYHNTSCVIHHFVLEHTVSRWPGRVFSHMLAIQSVDGLLDSLTELHIEYVDLLRVDMSGGEWPLLANLSSYDYRQLPFHQIIVDGTFRGQTGEVLRAMTELVQAGFYPFMTVPALRDCGAKPGPILHHTFSLLSAHVGGKTCEFDNSKSLGAALYNAEFEGTDSDVMEYRTGEPYMWDHYPVYPCKGLARVVPFADGGKYVCGLNDLRVRETCTILCIGVDGNTQFEDWMTTHSHCRVYAFDHTVGGVPHGAERIKFWQKGVGPRSEGQFLTLRDMVNLTGATDIDYLKIDVEGAEWGVFAAAVHQFGGRLPFEQIGIEVHPKRSSELRIFFSAMKQWGYYPVMYELNQNPCVVGRGPDCAEYVFLRNTSTFAL